MFGYISLIFKSLRAGSWRPSVRWGLAVGTGLLDLRWRLHGWVIWRKKCMLNGCQALGVTHLNLPSAIGKANFTKWCSYSACGSPLCQTAGHTKFTKKANLRFPNQVGSWELFKDFLYVLFWRCCQWWFWCLSELFFSPPSFTWRMVLPNCSDNPSPRCYFK